MMKTAGKQERKQEGKRGQYHYVCEGYAKAAWQKEE